MLATEQDTETHILGSGVSYPWYIHKHQPWSYDDDIQAPDGWSVDMTMWDGEHDDDNHTKVVTINHDRLIDAMRSIGIDHQGSASGECISECVAFLIDPETADFDADTADQVLQVLAYGQVVYG